MKNYLQTFYHSIFVRIYAGLILVCLFAAGFAFIVLQGFSAYRVQAYKENISSGAAFIIADGLARQTTPEMRQNWLNDAQIILNLELKIIPFAHDSFSSREIERLNQELAVLQKES